MPLSRSLFAAIVLTALAASARCEAQGARSATIMIGARIAAPVSALAAEALSPDVELEAPGARRRPTAPTPRPRAMVPDAAGATPGVPTSDARYRVVVRLAPDSAAAGGIAVLVRDADDREREVGRDSAVTVGRGLSASAARAAVVRLRLRSRVPDATIRLVYEVTSESALTM